MTPPPAAIIFDYDGVIADSEVVSNQCIARVLSAAGMPTTVEEAYALYMGRNRADTMAAMRARWGALVPADMDARITAEYRAMSAGPMTPVAGVTDFLARAAHLPCAVASSSASGHIRMRLGQIGLADRFGAHIYSGREHVARGSRIPTFTSMPPRHWVSILGGRW